MFVVLVGSVLTTGLFFQAFFGKGEASAGFILAVSLWLWFTVLFANFAEAMAEGRGKAQSESLRRARRDILAKKLSRPESTDCDWFRSLPQKKGFYEKFGMSGGRFTVFVKELHGA